MLRHGGPLTRRVMGSWDSGAGGSAVPVSGYTAAAALRPRLKGELGDLSSLGRLTQVHLNTCRSKTRRGCQMPTYRIRHYDGPTVNAAGHHVGRWRFVRFASLAEALAYQRIHGGTLYRPRSFARTKKRKRSRKPPPVEQVAPVGPASQGEHGAAR